jgi:hypothetical protein
MYRASSVITALKTSPDIEFDSPAPVCPKPHSLTCTKDIEHCTTGKMQNCKQKLTLFHHGCLRHLYFWFTVSLTDLDGVIDEQDGQLSILLTGKAISNSDLTTVPASLSGK